VELAQLLVDRFPALEKVRFTNSGTEANMMALLTARVCTGRDKMLVFEGGYHGSSISILPEARRRNAPFDFVYGKFNDLATTEEAVAACRDGLAAILVEPMLGAAGCIPAERSFLQGLREMADRSNAILIFDEVMTSRFGAAGAQGEYGITPDLMCCGKFLGGGGTFGAFGGRDHLMCIYDANRAGAVSHGGTFNNNVITMAAGLIGLRDIYTGELAAKFLDIGNTFRTDLNELASESGVAVQVTGMGSIMTVHFHDQPIRWPYSMTSDMFQARAIFHLAMLERGMYLARRGYLSLSIVQGNDDFSAFKSAFADVLGTYASVFNEAAERWSQKA
jgi:glutamate-1-semialdehyde 2,1-aminomutase